ncbi:hypothetical protein RJ639_038083 [Escallonia herrerae]|uniref:3-ketoacyl-CoA synthase n=1 Tax=Escallonia herrerae TaxID=1293975 RepID=A0AA89B5A6_9ASTE|nr:hypothetical protein RJ639_038083 [Escallonia herrerae]
MESFMFDQSSLTEILVLLNDFKFLAAITLTLAAIYLSHKANHVYLLDFICNRAPDHQRVPISTFIEHSEIMEKFNRNTIEFQKKVAERSAIGNETHVPPGFHLLPSENSFGSTTNEIETVLFSIVQALLTKHNINPRSIDILIINCSLVNRTPSLSAMVINKFRFRSNVKSFNLTGMGCSAGILSISLARDLLKVHKNSLALVLSMEPICCNVYEGQLKSMILANCLFRVGGAGILLSNRKRDRVNAKYELQHIVRTHLGFNTGAYKCVIQDLDDEGYTGIALSRTILQVAGEALKINLASLGSLVLPYSEQINYVLSVGWRKIWAPARKRGPYIPNFKKAFEHFCIHAGGRAVIDTIKDKLKLTDRDIEASKMTLYRFGNTSASSVWYSLCYLEAKGRVKRGDKVWQLAFGSGFKCNSAVWRCISNPKPDGLNAWSDRINRYPVAVPEVIDT